MAYVNNNIASAAGGACKNKSQSNHQCGEPQQFFSHYMPPQQSAPTLGFAPKKAFAAAAG